MKYLIGLLFLVLASSAQAQGIISDNGVVGTLGLGYQGPCDVVGTFKVFYGVRKCATSYNGNAMTIKRTSDNATCTLTYNATTGLLDVSVATPCTGTTTATAFCNATTCTITAFNDSSGGLACSGNVACNYAPTTPANITLVFNCTGSIPCIQMSGQTSTQSLTWAASSSQPYTATFVYNRTGGFTTGGGLFSTGNSVTLNLSTSSSANTFIMNAGTASEPVSPNDSSYNSIIGVVNAASSTWKLNAAAPATVASTPGSNASGTANVKALVGATGLTVRVLEIGFQNGGMTSGNQTSLYNNQSAFYGSIF